MHREEDAVLVATDAAARGLDIPHIAHVVQADFATSAVDFLHRVRLPARRSEIPSEMLRADETARSRRSD